VFPLLNPVGNESLGFGALSYAGQFNIMVVGDADAHPDIDIFAASARTTYAYWLSPTPGSAAGAGQPDRPIRCPQNRDGAGCCEWPA
jgi:hypothetical protein